ncbi:MAG: methyltransferase [Flavobacterium sp. BFFFF1]|uniref:class I SAM-dependent methyltransferase n=1 Tax=unclassified Flavobacterium TaxID=196869 RepID=UPI000BDD9903|nr:MULTISPECIES: class I SAM-dependent methyltransferase [unclassified Flavobacterium]OYU80812.1 MAG: methyltransferase [Flavobacterium sp. BFFFF1]
MKSTEAIIETNKKQKEFYNNIRQNFLTRIWAKFRNGILNQVRKNIGVQDQAYLLHKEWFGDLSDKKVLDLGCYAGNYWSIYLAQHARQYIGIDLSDVAIAKLAERLKPYPTASALAVDFLSDEFAEKDFDLIYAYGVLHHFESTPILIDRLNEKLADNGQVISYDPMETSIPIKIIRTIYRPFQTDADWEWPFSKKTLYQYREAFHIIEKHGLLGLSKWIVFVNMLPLSAEKKTRIGKNWHQKDWNNSATSDKALFRCMHLTMLMQKK